MAGAAPVWRDACVRFRRMLPIAAPPMPAASGSANSPAAGWFAVPDAGGGSAGTAASGEAIAGQGAIVPATDLGEPVMQFAMLLAPAVAVCALQTDVVSAADAGSATPVAVADAAPPTLAQDPQLADAMSQSSELLALLAAMSAPAQPLQQPEATVATGGATPIAAEAQLPAWAVVMAPATDAATPMAASTSPLIPVASWQPTASAGEAGIALDAAAPVLGGEAPVATTTTQTGAVSQISAQSAAAAAVATAGGPVGALGAPVAPGDAPAIQVQAAPEILAASPARQPGVPVSRPASPATSAAPATTSPVDVEEALAASAGIPVEASASPAPVATPAQHQAGGPSKPVADAAVPAAVWAAVDQAAASVQVVPAAVAKHAASADAATAASAVTAQTTAPIPPAAAAAVVTTGSEAAPVDAAPLPAPAATTEGTAAELATRSAATTQPAATAGAARSEQTAPSRPDPNPMERAVANQVSRAIVQHLPDGGTRMVMRLTPPELGTVRVEFLMRDGNISARMLAEDDGVRQALDRALPQIRSDVRGEHPTVDITVDRSDQRQAWQDGQGRHDQRDEQRNGAATRQRDGDDVFSLDEAGATPTVTVDAPRSAPVLGGRVTARSVDAFA